MADIAVKRRTMFSKFLALFRIAKSFVKRYKIGFYILTAITVSVAVTTLINNVFDLNRNYLILKKEVEEPQNLLSPNNPTSRISELMGQPLSIESFEFWKEYIYFSNGLWVKHIVLPNENPLAISFNSCNYKEVRLPISSETTVKKSVLVLNKTTFEQIPEMVDPYNASDKYVELSYIVGANYIYFIEEYGGGNPTNYQTYFWGFADLCNLNEEASKYLSDNVAKLNYKGNLADAPNEIKQFRKLVSASFIGQTALHATTLENNEKLLEKIGISKYIPRTLPQHTY